MGIREVKQPGAGPRVFQRAVFFDRDGVFTRLIMNPATGCYESPHATVDFILIPNSLESLKPLAEKYLLFLVSNQPSFAKGKTTLEAIRAIQGLFQAAVLQTGIAFTNYFYCYHHPQGIVPGYSGPCACRKPSPYFLNQAREQHRLDLAHSWFVGDQDIDVQCGQAAGVRTILIEEPCSRDKRGKSQPDFRAGSVEEAVKIILNS
jgi:D-glycero-D-manno-heptose 1,7-bisphosphate phosphatase